MTMIYNLLNFPAGSVPVSTVTAEDEEKLRSYTGNYRDRFDQLFREVRRVPVQCVPQQVGSFIRTRRFRLVVILKCKVLDVVLLCAAVYGEISS